MTKNTDKAIRFWLDSAKDNFETAKDMFKAGRWNFSMFMCQQTIEAFLKGVFIIQKNERPSYIHKLPKLLELTGVSVPPYIDIKILKIDAHYIKARYKEDRFDPKIYNRVNAERLISDTEEVLNWFIKNRNLKI